MIEMLIFLGFFSLGLIMGFFLKWWLVNRKINDYSGTIVVRRDELSERTVYTLELDDYPETLQFKKMENEFSPG